MTLDIFQDDAQDIFLLSEAVTHLQTKRQAVMASKNAWRTNTRWIIPLQGVQSLSEYLTIEEIHRIE
ncbi:MAG: hypothetical protein APF84_12910 [Gracilibacter sp. BRH_c7a]|nr:MAG: hypothetical protein APF84_12910 [Gracilibacter sp. BRH_c7a]